MGNPSPGQTGVEPNAPNEAWVPIQTWNMILISDTPISWFLSLDGVIQYRFYKGDVSPVPPEPEPVVGQIQGWSIPNSIAQAAGLIPTPPTPPGALTLAQQQGFALGNQYQEEIAPLSAPTPPEGAPPPGGS
jgi:hypothetical protein